MSSLTSPPNPIPGRLPATTDHPGVEHALAASTLHIETDGDLNHLLNALFRRRWLILGIVLGSLASAIAILLLATPRYTAETRILLEGNSYRVGTPLQPVIPVMSIDATTLNSQV